MNPRDLYGLLAFRPVNPSTDEGTVEFELMDGSGMTVPAKALQGSTAVLCSFQRITATSQEERDLPLDDFQSLLRAIFPDVVDDPLRPLESLVRPTGNHWGPMRIGATE